MTDNVRKVKDVKKRLTELEKLKDNVKEVEAVKEKFTEMQKLKEKVGWCKMLR